MEGCKADMKGGGGSTPVEVIRPERRWIDQVYNIFRWGKGGGGGGGGRGMVEELVKAVRCEGGVYFM